METQQIFILSSSFVIACSGICINLIKKGDSEEDKTKDENTLVWFRILVPLGLILSLAFYFMKIGAATFSVSILFIGGLFVILGLIMRWYSIWYLGKAFTVQVKIIDNHELMSDGIYKYIRHPSYTGLLMYYLGLGLVMENWMSLSILIIAPLIAVLYRIQLEEKVLMQHFKTAYQAYQMRSWRLIPFIY